MTLKTKVKLSEAIAPTYYKVFNDIQNNRHTHYKFPGGRLSGKSSFVSIVIILGLMSDPDANAIALMRYDRYLKESVYSQLLWAIDYLKVSDYWKLNLSPLKLTYIPFGNVVLFRGADDPNKSKSIKLRKGFFKYIWYEERDLFDGPEEERKINQSLIRGGKNYVVLYTWNPPKSLNNWTNQDILVPRDDTYIHKSTYLDLPSDWVGEQSLIEAEHLRDTNFKAYENEYLGIATGTGGSVFDNLTIREISNDEFNSFDKISDGVDFGFAVDPAVYTQNHYDSKYKKLYIFNEIYSEKMSNKKLWETIREVKVGSSPIVADSAEPKSISELNDYGGIRVVGAKKGPDSVDYGIKWLQDLSEIIIDPIRCPNHVREFTSYEYERDRYGNFKSRYPDIDNHTIDATRYSREKDMKFNKMKTGGRKII